MRNAIVMGVMALGACGGDGSPVCHRDGGEACFELPTAPVRWYEPGGASGPAVIGCGALVPVPSTMAVALSGRVVAYDSAAGVAGATLELFGAADYASAIATATTDGSGAYALNLASGTPDLLWGRLTGGGIEAQLIDQLWPDLSEATVAVDFTTSTRAFLDMYVASEVEVARDAGLAQLQVHVLDCGRRAIIDAVVVLSATAGQRDFVDGAPVFYSVIGPGFPLPTARDEVSDTGPDGAAVLVNVPVDGGALYVQAWGFPDAAAVARGEDGLVLIAEYAATRRAGASTRVNLWANR